MPTSPGNANEVGLEMTAKNGRAPAFLCTQDDDVIMHLLEVDPKMPEERRRKSLAHLDRKHKRGELDPTIFDRFSAFIMKSGTNEEKCMYTA